jgi:hypothetical protein
VEVEGRLLHAHYDVQKRCSGDEPRLRE